MNKVCGGDGIPAELFQILKDAAATSQLKYYTQYASKFGKHSSGHRTGKGQFSKKGHAKECPNSCTIAFKSDANKVKFKII